MLLFCANTPELVKVSAVVYHGSIHINGALGLDHIPKYGNPSKFIVSSVLFPVLCFKLILCEVRFFIIIASLSNVFWSIWIFFLFINILLA